MSAFAVGMTVTWTSQAKGTMVTKKGVVVEVVAAGRLPITRMTHLAGSRKEESYIVAVRRTDKRGRDLPAQHYWPKSSHLSLFAGSRPIVAYRGEVKITATERAALMSLIQELATLPLPAYRSVVLLDVIRQVVDAVKPVP